MEIAGWRDGGYRLSLPGVSLALRAMQAAAREFALDTALGYGERAIRFDGAGWR